nr:hypothetical protein [uncultured Cohaesibacter sp.]
MHEIRQTKATMDAGSRLCFVAKDFDNFHVMLLCPFGAHGFLIFA